MKKILCIDDATYTLASIKEALSDEFEVLLARDSQSAIQKAMDEEIDLIIIDPQIDKEDGIELLNYLTHSEPRYLETPIIVLTATSDEAQQEKLARFNVEAILNKPCVVSKLRRNIDDAFIRRKLSQNSPSF